VLGEIGPFQNVVPWGHVGVSCVHSEQELQVFLQCVLFSELFQGVYQCELPSLFQVVLNQALKLVFYMVIEILGIDEVFHKVLVIHGSLRFLSQLLELELHKRIMLIFKHFVSEELEVEVESTGSVELCFIVFNCGFGVFSLVEFKVLVVSPAHNVSEYLLLLLHGVVVHLLFVI